MAEIQIQWLGHSCFRVECQGYAIVLDPFEPGSVPGLRDIQQTADQVLCSHEHHDHNYRAGVALRETGAENPFAITAFPSFHGDCGGEKRGPTPSTCWRPAACGWPTWGTLAACPPRRFWSGFRSWTP